MPKCIEIKNLRKGENLFSNKRVVSNEDFQIYRHQVYPVTGE